MTELTLPLRLTPKAGPTSSDDPDLEDVSWRLENFFEGVAEGVGENNVARAYSDAERWALIGALAAIRVQVLALKAQVAELEARPALAFKGVWRSGQTYPEGSAATHGGGLWVALRATAGRPNDSADWVLAVKKGAA